MKRSAKNWNTNSKLQMNKYKKYGSHAIVILAKEKNKSQNEKQTKNQIMSRLYSTGLYYILVGHISDALVKILFRLMKAWKIYSTKAIVYENHRAAPE